MHCSKTFSLLFVMVILLFISGCYYDKEDLLYPSSDCSTLSAKFSVDVLPLIQTNCNIAGCHNATSAAGTVVLDTYDNIHAKVARINQRCIVDKTMPPGAPLSPAAIAILNCWILSGSPNN